MATELKTLDELEGYDTKWNDSVARWRMKDEAIKEILLLQEEGEKKHNIGLFKFADTFFLHDQYNHSEFFLLVRYIKWKFNITDKDIEEFAKRGN